MKAQIELENLTVDAARRCLKLFAEILGVEARSCKMEVQGDFRDEEGNLAFLAGNWSRVDTSVSIPSDLLLIDVDGDWISLKPDEEIIPYVRLTYPRR